MKIILFQVTFEMQANDLIADLRAEVSAWWEGKMADHRSSVIAAATAALVNFGGSGVHTQICKITMFVSRTESL
jgi:hypothetical protein